MPLSLSGKRDSLTKTGSVRQGWPKMTTQEQRRKKLAAALRDNLKRRKAQDRSRRNSAADQGEKGAAEATLTDVIAHPGAQE